MAPNTSYQVPRVFDSILKSHVQKVSIPNLSCSLQVKVEGSTEN